MGLCSLLPKVFWKMTSRITCNLLEKILVSSNFDKFFYQTLTHINFGNS